MSIEYIEYQVVIDWSVVFDNVEINTGSTTCMVMLHTIFLAFYIMQTCQTCECKCQSHAWLL